MTGAFDTSELDKLGRDFVLSIPVMQKGIRGVVSKGAVNIKKVWRSNARESSGHQAPAYPYSISYGLSSTLNEVEAEIGPDKNKPQGALGNLLEYGSAHNPPHDDGGRALRAEEPNTEHWVQIVAAQAIAPK